jgi:teichuronic acid biosynthesis glycosyltransferase TuaG
MPAYNAEKTIEAAIKSVLMQTHADWELIIIDDNSQDETRQKINSGQDPRITLLINEKNRGAAKTRNRGIENSKGKWLAFLDSDDTWHPEKLEKQLRFMEENNAKISYTATAYVYEGIPSNFILQAKKNFFYKDLIRQNLMSCSSVMVDREIMPPFPQGNLHEDYAAWLKILQKIDCAHGLNEPLLTYNIAAKSKSRNRIKSAIMTCNAYRNVNYGVFRAVLLTLRYSLHSIKKHSSIQRKKIES